MQDQKIGSKKLVDHALGEPIKCAQLVRTFGSYEHAHQKAFIIEKVPHVDIS